MTSGVSAALVLFAHGSSDARWAEPFEALKRKVTDRRPGIAVELAFLERMAPSLSDVIQRLAPGRSHITIAPLFMGKGAHVRRDLVELVEIMRSRYPGVRIDVLTAIGEAEPVLDAMTAWLVEQL